MIGHDVGSNVDRFAIVNDSVISYCVFMPDWPPSTGKVVASNIVKVPVLEVNIVLATGCEVLRHGVMQGAFHVDLDKVPPWSKCVGHEITDEEKFIFAGCDRRCKIFCGNDAFVRLRFSWNVCVIRSFL